MDDFGAKDLQELFDQAAAKLKEAGQVDLAKKLERVGKLRR
ncbi:hypothetical protein [Desulfonatronospira thiodismutans]|nr:hypothetical protein [Desulfonatronospira thiodismutans]